MYSIELEYLSEWPVRYYIYSGERTNCRRRQSLAVASDTRIQRRVASECACLYYYTYLPNILELVSYEIKYHRRRHKTQTRIISGRSIYIISVHAIRFNLLVRRTYIYFTYNFHSWIPRSWRPQQPSKRQNWTVPIPECENSCTTCTETFWGIITIKPTLCWTRCRNTKWPKTKGSIDSYPVYCKSAARDLLPATELHNI